MLCILRLPHLRALSHLPRRSLRLPPPRAAATVPAGAPCTAASTVCAPRPMELSPWDEADAQASHLHPADPLSASLAATPLSLLSPRQQRQRKAEAAAEERKQRTIRMQTQTQAQAPQSLSHSSGDQSAAAASWIAAASSSAAAVSASPALHAASGASTFSLPLIDRGASSGQTVATGSASLSPSPPQQRIDSIATSVQSASSPSVALSPSQQRLRVGALHPQNSEHSIAGVRQAAMRTLQLPSPPKHPQQPQPLQPQQQQQSAASLHHSQSVPAVNSASQGPGAGTGTGGGSGGGGPLSPLSFSHSTASLTSAQSSPKRNARAAARSRLYAGSSSQSQLSLASYAGLACPPLFVPRHLPLPDPREHGPLIARWMALLAWERGGAEGLLERVRTMESLLADQIREHQKAMEIEVAQEAQRVADRAEIQAARLRRRAALLAESDASVPAHLRRAKVRFGGVLQPQPVEAESLGPSTLRIPAHHTAFVCDMLDRVCEDTGRIAPVIRRVVRTLFQACYQGFDEGNDEAQPSRLLLSAASSEEKQQQTSPPQPTHASSAASQPSASSPSASSSSASAAATDGSPPSLSTAVPLVLPYFHVSQLLNVEYHRGAALIDCYVDTQQSMHVQSLRRADVLNGSVARMQATLNHHVFTRWKFVAKQRRRQRIAHQALMARWMLNPAHLKVHFLTWKSAALNSRAHKDEMQHSKANLEVSALQADVAAARKSCVNESAKLQSSRDSSKSLHRQRDELLRQIRLVSLQQSALDDRGLHRLLDGSFEILRAAMESLSTELEQARGLDLQDPLRILHPTRTSWEWDTVYGDAAVGSQLWAHARRRELEAARAFFDGSGVVHESNLAHTKAAAAPATNTTATATAASTGPAPKAKPHHHGHSASMAVGHDLRSPQGRSNANTRTPSSTGTNNSGSRRRTASSSEHPSSHHHRSHSSASHSSSSFAGGASSVSSVSASAYNYSQEVELILLWVNFHLIQSQNKILQAKQEQMHKRAMDKKKRKAAAAAAAAAEAAAKVAAKGGKKTLAASSSSSSLQSVSIEESGAESAGDGEDGEMDWFDGASASASASRKSMDEIRKETEAKNRRARSNLQQGRASLSANILERVFSPHSQDKTPSPSAAAAESVDADAASSESQLKSRSYFIAQFTSAEAMARRCENFTTSLQDGELLLRLLSEVAPPGVADTEMLMHVDLQSRARLLIRMLERFDPDLGSMVTSLDFVHAFNSDRVAALLARLWIASPQTGIQGAWFDADDFSNQTTTTDADGATVKQQGRKPFLRATDPKQLAQQMDDAGADGGGDFGPLHQLHLELAQLQHAASARHRISVACIHELHAAVKRILSAGRRILDDAYARHDLWVALRNRMKSFVVAILVAHVRGRPLKLDDPRALAERQSFCALLDNPMHAMLRKQKERLEASERARQTAALSSSAQIASAIENLRASTDTDAWEEEMESLHFPYGKPQSRFMDLIAEENRTYVIRSEVSADGTAAAVPAPVQSIPAYLTVAGTTKQREALSSTVSARHSPLHVPHHVREGSADSDEDAGKLSGLSAIAADHRSLTSSRRSSFNATSTPAAPAAAAVVSLPHVLSFELHVIQNLLHVFYEPLKQIWRAYAQADTGTGKLGANPGGGGGAIASSNSMNLLETWALVRDCGLCSPSAPGSSASAASSSSLTAKQVEQVFLECFMSPAEKSSPASKAATASQGSLAMLTALVFDPATGLAAPPKDKSQLELREHDFIELLVRIAFLRRRISPREKRETIAEWRGFQLERREEMKREKQRKKEQARAQRRALRAARHKEAGLDDSAFSSASAAAAAAAAQAGSAPNSEEDGDLFLSDSDDDSAASGSGDDSEVRRHIDFDALDPLASTVSGSRATFHDRLYEGMSGAGSGATAESGGAVDETFGVELSESNAAQLNLGLALRFFGLLKLRILPHASKLDSDSFRAAYKTRAVSKQFRKHGSMLKKLFFHYATMHTVAVSALDGARADSWDNTIDYAEYLTLLRDLHLLESSSSAAAAANSSSSSSSSGSLSKGGGMLLSHDQCYSIFANVQQDLHVANAAVTNAKVQRNQPWAPTHTGLGHSASATALAERNAAAAAAAVEAEKIKQAAQKAKRQSKRRSTAAPKQKGAAPSPLGVSAALNAKLQKRMTLDRKLPSLDESAGPSASVTRAQSKRGSKSDPAGAEGKDGEHEESEESDDSDHDEDGAAAAPEIEPVPSVAAPAAIDSADASAAYSHLPAAASVSSDTPDVGLSRARDFHSPTMPGSAADSPLPPEGALSADQELAGDPSSGNPLLSATATHLSAVGASAAQSSREMIYPEYLEALAAIACCRYPNPYKSTAEKIEAFLDSDVLPQIPKLLRRQHSTAVQED